MTRKLLSVLCALCLMLTILSACATAETPSDTTGENVTLNYISWMTKGEDIPTLDDFMAEYPNIKVTNQSLDGANYAQLVNTMLMGGTVPDVFLSNFNMLPDLVKGGYIQPVDGIPGVEKQAANESINNMLSVGGRVYAYAINGSKNDLFVYYNKIYFEKNGFKVPTTVEEFEQLMADIAAKGDEALAVSAGDTWSAKYAALQFYWNNVFELNLVAPHNAELSILSGETKLSDLYRETFTRLSTYMSNGWVSKNALSMGWEQTAQYVVDGGAQMFVSGNWVPASTPVQQADPEAFELGCFPLPHPVLSDGKTHVRAGTDRVIVLSAESKHPAEAQKLFEYFISDDVLIKYLERQGLMGMNVNVDVDPVFEYSYDYFDKLGVVWETGVLSMMPPGYEAMINQYSADIFTGASIDELLSKLDADYEAAMSTVNTQEYIDAIKAAQN